MNSPTRRDLVATDMVTLPVSSQDRFARTDGRPQRSQPLLRTIEVAHLLPNLTPEFSQHRAPRTAIYEQTCGAFARGTLVQSCDGPIAVEDLLPGDYVETSRGPQAVLWIGSTNMMTGAASEGSSLTHLARVTSDAFGPARPSCDLVLGPAARLRHNPPELIDHVGATGVLSPVGDFVDGMSVIDVTPPSAVQLYHLAFRRHATFKAGGIEVESFHPGTDLRDRLGDNARTLFLSLFPHLSALSDFGPLSLPRISRDALGGFAA